MNILLLTKLKEMRVIVKYYNRHMEIVSIITSLPMKNDYGSEPMQSIFGDGFSVRCEDLITIEHIDDEEDIESIHGPK